jgi:hypothetical protein
LIPSLEDLNAKAGAEDTCKSTTGSESLHEISTDNGIIAVYFATPENLSRVRHSHITTFINGLLMGGYISN